MKIIMKNKQKQLKVVVENAAQLVSQKGVKYVIQYYSFNIKIGDLEMNTEF
jgi:hypothetical protein